MSPLVLKLRTQPAFPVDMSRLQPDHLSGLNPASVAALPLWQGRREVRVGDLFEVTGDDCSRVLIRDACTLLDHLGAEMTGGELRVEGNAGDYLGRDLAGGTIRLQGDCGAFTASAMRGGLLQVSGDAGHFLGAPRAGGRIGISGGTIVVSGSVGDRAGDRMRRGMLLIAGDAGAYCGSRMIAGTIVVLGQAGQGVGQGMQRGSIVLGTHPVAVSESCHDVGYQELGFLTLLARSVSKWQGPFSTMISRGTRVRRYQGDRANNGLGEILVLSEHSTS